MAETRPNITLPAGYTDESEFLNDMRHMIADDQAFDRYNREAGVEDLMFLTGEQWDSDLRERRERRRRPTLTINRIPAFVAQVVGSRLQNETQIHVRPESDGKKEIAEVREGLIRAIQRNSNAQAAFDNSLFGAVACGIGNFRISINYENDEVWHHSIHIDTIPDHFAVVWDRKMSEPSGGDAAHCVILERMAKDTFNTRYPWATPSDVISMAMPAELRNSEWYSQGDVQIANYWAMREHKRRIALLISGATVDITGKNASDSPEDAKIIQSIMVGRDGEPMVREVYRKYAQLYRCSGADVLEGPYDLPIDRVPVFRVPGWEVKIGEQSRRWGIIRNMKDPQRLQNYWRSSVAEKLMQTPRATWVAPDTAVSGREQSWRDSATSDDPLLIWNAESGQPPQRMPPATLESALITEAQITTQDMKDVSNIHEANLGMPSNEVSGVAIRERVAVSDTGTALYNQNLSRSITECGRVINELIPTVYDTERVVSILGDDDTEREVILNVQNSPDAIDITSGKYSVIATVGASYKTKRQENREAMLALAQSLPQMFSLAGDLLVESMDWPMADKIAARLRKTLPPQLLSPDEITPEIAQAAQAKGQAQQQAMQAEVRKQMSDYLLAQSKTAQNFAQAQHYRDSDQLAATKLHVDTFSEASKAADRDLRARLEVIRAATGG